MTPDKKHADWRRGDRVGIGQPEVEGHNRSLDQESGDDEDEGDHDQPVWPGAGDGGADLGHVQRPGAPIDDGDAGQRQVGAHAVGDGEVQGTLQRPAFFGPVGGEGVGRHPHQLEPDEEIEDVAGEAEADHARQEGQHEDVVVGGHPLEVTPGKDHGCGHEDGGQAGQPGAQRPGGEVDADGDPVGWAEAGKPVDRVPVGRARHDHRQDGRDRGSGDDGGRVQGPPFAAEQHVQRRYRRRHQKRQDGGQSQQRVHSGAFSL